MTDRTQILTIENAKEWASTGEQFTFCIDLLEISAQSSAASSMVNALENAFLELLE